MSAETLRLAASLLRELAEDANPAPWSCDRNAVRTGRHALALTYDIHYGNDRDQTAKDAHYIATMHPGVGLALADVLDESAAVWDDIEDAPRPDSQLERLARLARLVLGGAS